MVNHDSQLGKMIRHAGDGSDETEIGIRAVEYQAAIGQHLQAG